jgi:hypothetical protein
LMKRILNETKQTRSVKFRVKDNAWPASKCRLQRSTKINKRPWKINHCFIPSGSIPKLGNDVSKRYSFEGKASVIVWTNDGCIFSFMEILHTRKAAHNLSGWHVGIVLASYKIFFQLFTLIVTRKRTLIRQITAQPTINTIRRSPFSSRRSAGDEVKERRQCLVTSTTKYSKFPAESPAFQLHFGT